MAIAENQIRLILAAKIMKKIESFPAVLPPEM